MSTPAKKITRQMYTFSREELSMVISALKFARPKVKPQSEERWDALTCRLTKSAARFEEEKG